MAVDQVIGHDPDVGKAVQGFDNRSPQIAGDGQRFYPDFLS
jgi:hypothetical protein